MDILPRRDRRVWVVCLIQDYILLFELSQSDSPTISHDDNDTMLSNIIFNFSKPFNAYFIWSQKKSWKRQVGESINYINYHLFSQRYTKSWGLPTPRWADWLWEIRMASTSKESFRTNLGRTFRFLPIWSFILHSYHQKMDDISLHFVTHLEFTDHFHILDWIIWNCQYLGVFDL